MIKFFRKIRQQLLTENKISKYLIYAIGEIFLVVIGILIALTINNQNEFRKDRIEENDYLTRIQLDLRKDILYLKTRIKFMQNQKKAYYSFLHKMYDEQETKEDFTNLLIGVFWDAEELILQDNTFSEISSSGKFGIITKTDVKEAMIDYYKEYSFIKSHLSEMNETGLKLFLDVYPMLTKFFIDSMHDENQMHDRKDLSFINNPNSNLFKTLESSAYFYSTKSKQSEEYFNQLLTKANNLLKLIDN